MISSTFRTRGRSFVTRTIASSSLLDSGASNPCRTFASLFGGLNSSNPLFSGGIRPHGLIENEPHINSNKPTLKSLGVENDKLQLPEGPHRMNRRTKRRKTRNAREELLARPKNSRSIRVKAVHAAQTMDVVKVLSHVFGHSTRHMFGKSGVFVELPPISQEIDDSMARRFVAIFRFGSVVLFNVPPREAGKLLEQIKRVGATKPVSAGFERKEHFEVVIYPQLQEVAHVVNGDYCIVDSLNMDGVAVIASIMGQTVALDSYSDTVDELLANFSTINSNVTQRGKSFDVEKTALFQVVSMNNSIFIDMVSKLGIKDRSDLAWNLSQYERVHEGLKDEFEIDDRFKNIEFKLDLIQQNAKFFLEILHSQKSNSLEWAILVLITFECVLMCLEMSGLGPALFGITGLPP